MPNDFDNMFNKIMDQQKYEKIKDMWGSDDKESNAYLFDKLKKVYIENGYAEMFNHVEKCCICTKELSEDVDKIYFNGKKYCKKCFDNEKFTCSCCKKKFHSTDISISKKNGEFICKSCEEKYNICKDCNSFYLKSKEEIKDVCPKCLKEKYKKCDSCNNYHYKKSVITATDVKEKKLKNICESCIKEKNIKIDRCDICCELYINDVQLYRVGERNEISRRICSNCYKTRFFTCSDCGYTYTNDEMCDDMSGKHCKRCNPISVILNYSYKPVRYKFIRNDDEANHPTYLGIEFEIGGCRHSSHIDTLIQTFTNRNGFYFKKDSSIPSFGVEIVSHPATLLAHQKTLPWESIFSEINRLGITNYSGCGIHCHVGRDSFSREQISFLDCFININFEKFEILGGRQFNDYCKRMLKRRVEWGSSMGDRHTAINLENGSTVEFRFCSSTNNYNDFMNRIQLIDSIVKFSKSKELTYKNIFIQNDEIWSDYLMFCKDNYHFMEDFDLSKLL